MLVKINNFGWQAYTPSQAAYLLHNLEQEPLVSIWAQLKQSSYFLIKFMPSSN